MAGWLAKGIIISTIVLGSGVTGGSIGYLTNKNEEEKQEPPIAKVEIKEPTTKSVEKTKQTIKVPRDFSFCRWLHWNNWTKVRRRNEQWCKKQMEKEYIILYK